MNIKTINYLYKKLIYEYSLYSYNLVYRYETYYELEEQKSLFFKLIIE